MSIVVALRRAAPLPASESGPFGPVRSLGAAPFSAIGPTDRAHKEEVAHAVRQAVGALQERQRLAVLLNKFEDMSYQQIAEVMNLSEKAVKSLLEGASPQPEHLFKWNDRHWTDLLEFYTDDAIYIDPAWGRVEGLDAIREFMIESMLGLEDWLFPVEFTAVSGDDVAVKWLQILPGARPDGSRWVQSGWSRLVYDGNGRFRYQEDMLNMSHVIEDLGASGWRPGPGFSAPPAQPDRDISIPER